MKYEKEIQIQLYLFIHYNFDFSEKSKPLHWMDHGNLNNHQLHYLFILGPLKLSNFRKFFEEKSERIPGIVTRVKKFPLYFQCLSLNTSSPILFQGKR